MKFAGKKIISIALVALLVVSTLIVGTVSAGATTNLSGIYVKSSQTYSKIYFAVPIDDSSWNSSRVFMLMYTDDDKVYSVRINNIANSSLNYIGAYTAKNHNSLSWDKIESIAFYSLKTGNTLSNYDKVEVTSIIGDVESLSAEALNKIDAYTSKYSSVINDNSTVTNHYFYTTSSNNSATVYRQSSASYVSRTQTINLQTTGGEQSIGGTVTASSYTQSDKDAFGTLISGNNGDSNSFSISPTLGAATTLSATADSLNDYIFSGWYDGETLLSSETSLTYYPVTDSTITAKFVYDDGTPRYDMTATPVGNGTASVSPVRAAEGETVNFSATPDDGYLFGGWYTDSECTILESYNNPYTYTVGTAAKNLYAKFGTGIAQSANVGDSGGGTAKVSGNGSSGSSLNIVSGTKASFAAIPNPQYKFIGWYSNSACTGEAVSTADPYTITVSSTNTLYAKFSEATYSSEEVTLTESDKNDGSRNPYDSENTYTATLSNKAKDYYKDTAKQYLTSGKVYQSFVSLAGAEQNDSSNSYNAAFGNHTNSLFNALYNIMDSTQNHGVVYASYGRNSLAHYWLYTDTSSVNSNDGRGPYTFFYSDVTCYNHENMQREHIWPKSKASYLMKTGLGGSDLHHLRPAYGKVNNIKSNWGFADIRNSDGSIKDGWRKVRTVDWPSGTTALWRAEKSGETFCDYNDDVHGDIARILLYIYTRWKQPNLYSDITKTDEDGQIVPDTSRLPELDPDDSKDTGERIIYDLPTLLQWMKEDPVSEWEMKRNDLTQKVQGNRNVFIDYPELAWLLFDQSVPTDMDTPSGMAKANGNYSTDIEKTATPTLTDPVTLDFKTDGNGAAHITAFDNTTNTAVKDGDQVNRGDIITYYIIPDESTLTKYIEFSSDGNGTGNDDRNTIDFADTTEAYSFSRQAGYFRDNLNSSYNKDRIKIVLSSSVCVISYNINSKTAYPKYGSGGSGSGMVTVSNATTHERIENGGTVPNGTSITFTFTPDYGSKFHSISNSNSIVIPTPTQITGTDSYQTTFTVSSLNNNNEEIGRNKKFTVYFAQTFNFRTNDAETGLDKHINNKGLRPDEDDPFKEQTDFTENFEICGVQVKQDTENSENKALRFISVADNKILQKAKSFGYVITYTKHNFTVNEGTELSPVYKNDYSPINRNGYLLVKGGANVKTLDCTGTANTYFGDYGRPDSDKNYVYFTAAINNIQNATGLGNSPLDTTIVARPYIELKDKWVGEGAPHVIYGQYVDVSSGEEFCACSGSYNYVAGLSSVSN